jgi:ParB/RepB/Spo0J family partition protein
MATAAVPPVDDRIVHQIPLADIRPSPRNPRQRLDGLDELAESLRTHGLLQPVVVGRRGRGYELIAGHRRLEAARRLGWAEIAAVVRDETDDQAYILTLVENLQREDLQPREEAAALEVLVRERGWSTRQVGEAIKRSHIYVSRRLRVFDDPMLAPLSYGASCQSAQQRNCYVNPTPSSAESLLPRQHASNGTKAQRDGLSQPGGT